VIGQPWSVTWRPGTTHQPELIFLFPQMSEVIARTTSILNEELGEGVCHRVDLPAAPSPPPPAAPRFAWYAFYKKCSEYNDNVLWCLSALDDGWTVPVDGKKTAYQRLHDRITALIRELNLRAMEAARGASIGQRVLVITPNWVTRSFNMEGGIILDSESGFASVNLDTAPPGEMSLCLPNSLPNNYGIYYILEKDLEARVESQPLDELLRHLRNYPHPIPPRIEAIRRQCNAIAPAFWTAAREKVREDARKRMRTDAGRIRGPIQHNAFLELVRHHGVVYRINKFIGNGI
jgi:hypothetical protein